MAPTSGEYLIRRRIVFKCLLKKSPVSAEMLLRGPGLLRSAQRCGINACGFETVGQNS